MFRHVRDYVVPILQESLPSRDDCSMSANTKSYFSGRRHVRRQLAVKQFYHVFL